jgi:hypothetical protein
MVSALRENEGGSDVAHGDSDGAGQGPLTWYQALQDVGQPGARGCEEIRDSGAIAQRRPVVAPLGENTGGSSAGHAEWTLGVAGTSRSCHGHV